jgi:hypothetical protein
MFGNYIQRVKGDIFIVSIPCIIIRFLILSNKCTNCHSFVIIYSYILMFSLIMGRQGPKHVAVECF